MEVYVLNKDNKPQMPTTPRKARILLKFGKAKIVSITPFVIKLKYGSSGYKQEIVASMDSGYRYIGCAAGTNDKIIYQSEVELRQDIKANMTQRRMYRRNRRSRKTNYRETRFDNRKGIHLPPSVQSKYDSHIREMKYLESILPVTRWIIEIGEFDIHKITNPDVIDYQSGDKKGFYNTKAYVLHRDGYKCQSKEKEHSNKLHVHHKIYRSNGGSDLAENLIVVCDMCHDKIHNNEIILPVKKNRSKTQPATQMNIIGSWLMKNLTFERTFGYITKYNREQLGLSKSHANDAIAMIMKENDVINTPIYKKKHVAHGDYQLRKGQRSEVVIPTGKMHGFRKFDYVKSVKGSGFIKGRRSSGYFALMDISGNVISNSVTIKNMERINARTTTRIESTRFPPCPEGQGFQRGLR